MRLAIAAESPDEMMVAALHDVVEDSEFWTLARLADEGIPPRVLAALEVITQRGDEDYQAFITRVLGDPLATRVKLRDLEDNMNVRRLASFSAHDAERLGRYHLARKRIASALGMGTAASSLVVKLDEQSVAGLRERAVHPDVRADHVTLAHGLAPSEFDARWSAGGHGVGDRVRVRVLDLVANDRVQVARVEIDGERERRWDRGVLHVTVSKIAGAKSAESNRVLEAQGSASGVVVNEEIEGVVGWG
jgi:hypothetical protein